MYGTKVTTGTVTATATVLPFTGAGGTYSILATAIACAVIGGMLLALANGFKFRFAYEPVRGADGRRKFAFTKNGQPIKFGRKR